MKKIINIFIVLTIIFANFLCIFWDCSTFFVKSNGYFTISNKDDLKPMYFVKNIDVAENENILLSTDNGIFMFNNHGQCVCFLRLNNDFMFKVKENKLIIIGKNANPNEPYYRSEYLINNNALAFNKENYDYSLSYEDCCKKENVINSKEINIKNTNFKYEFYGKVKITQNNISKVIDLETVYFPLHRYYVYIVDSFLLLVLLAKSVIVVFKKHKIEKAS